MKTKKISNAIQYTFLAIIALLFSSCQKYVSDEQTIQNVASGEDVVALQKDNASVATDWYQLQLRMILSANPVVSNLATVRMFGYTGITLYEAARFEIRNSKSLQAQLCQMPEMPKPEDDKNYSWVISANAALALITRYIFPGLTAADSASIDSLEKAYNRKYRSMTGENVFDRSKTFGKAVAAAIFDWSKSDLFDHANDPYTPPVFPGAWVPTPPLFAPAAVPYLGNCRTFLRMHSHGTTPPPLYKYSTKKGSDFYMMVNHLYKLSQTLTDEQKNIALYWNDVGPGVGYTPMGHSMSIVTQVLENSKASLATAEEVYLKTGMAMWDAAVYCWRSKFKYNLLRPVTYVQQNIDSTWLPLLSTPPHPEYPAAHAFITSSVMEVMTSIFGGHYNFTDHTYDFLGMAPRSYDSFEQCARECGKSRVYGGIHYQPSVNVGHDFGESIGNDIAAIQLTK